jgi:hypothetical protein
MAVEAARRGLDRIDARADPAMARARLAGRAGTPLFVHRLDADHADYYLVPWHDERGIVAIVQVDARSGAMTSAVGLPSPSSRLVMTQDDARGAVSATFGERTTGQPDLVWQPCRESASPFQPLYRVPVEHGHVFVGIDGAVHRSLTPFGRGG